MFERNCRPYKHTMNKQTKKTYTHTHKHTATIKFITNIPNTAKGIVVFLWMKIKKNQPEPFKGIPDAFGFSYKPKKNMRVYRRVYLCNEKKNLLPCESFVKLHFRNNYTHIWRISVEINLNKLANDWGAIKQKFVFF